MAIVIEHDGSQREVKNLGWLLRHSAEVEWLEIQEGAQGDGCYLVAHMGTGPSSERRYETPFGSYRVCWNWLQRRRLAHASIDVQHPALRRELGLV
jgi:hypothetical protein